MEIVNYSGRPIEQLYDLYSVLAKQRSLNAVIDWVVTEKIPFPNIIAQDEFTLDVVVRWRDNLVVVYDTT